MHQYQWVTAPHDVDVQGFPDADPEALVFAGREPLDGWTVMDRLPQDERTAEVARAVRAFLAPKEAPA